MKSNYVITGIFALVIGFVLIMGCLEMEPATLDFVSQILGSPSYLDAYYQGIGMGAVIAVIGLILVIVGAVSPSPKKATPPPVFSAPTNQVNQKAEAPSPHVTDKTKVLGYLLAYRDVTLQDISSKFNIDVAQVEEIIMELLAEGKIKGHIDPETHRFKLYDEAQK